MFLNNARKSCAPFIEIIFPRDKFLHGKILSRSPLNFSPPPQKKSPENICTFPNSH